jgi:hypothetical protein
VTVAVRVKVDVGVKVAVNVGVVVQVEVCDGVPVGDGVLDAAVDDGVTVNVAVAAVAASQITTSSANTLPAVVPQFPGPSPTSSRTGWSRSVPPRVSAKV